MIRITVDAALKRSLDSEGRRDPLLQEIFHEGDSIAQCPACKSWMLTQSWEALGGSCACSYKPGSTERVQIRRTEAAPAAQAAPAAPEARATPTPPPSRLAIWPLPRWVFGLIGVAVVAALPLLAPKLPSPPEVPPRTEPQADARARSEPVPEPPAPLETSRQTVEKWTLTVSRRRGDPAICELTTPSIGTDGAAPRSDRSILVAVKGGYGTISVKGLYRAGSEVLLQVHGAAYRLSDYESAPHASADDVKAIIEVFKAGLEARTSGTTISATQTSDVYSLVGFTASLNRALETCGK